MDNANVAGQISGGPKPLCTKFLIQSVLDVLPDPSKLHTWGLADTPYCKLCQRKEYPKLLP